MQGITKLTKYAVLALMLLVGGVSPMLQTLDNDENLGITFLEPSLSAHAGMVKAPAFHAGPMALPGLAAVTHAADSQFEPSPHFFSADSRLMRRTALAMLAIPLRP